MALAWGCGASPPEPATETTAPAIVLEPSAPPAPATVTPAAVTPATVTPATVTSATVTPTPFVSTTSRTPTSTGPSLYEIHEWGVIDVQESGEAEIATGAGPAPRLGGIDTAMPLRKPVIYFHLTDGIDLLAVDVRAHILGGSIYETYPPDARPSPDVAQWHASLSPGPCATNPSARDLPARWVNVPGCATPDGICEVTELPRYDAATASCVEVGGVRAGMLFYRGTATPTLPLSVTRLPDFTVQVTANGSTAGAPGSVLRVSTALSGPWPMGYVVISRAPMPAHGSSVSLPVGSIAVDRTATRAELAQGLSTLGLDEAESDAFLGAWMTAFFGPEPGASGRAAGAAPPVPQDSLIYFLPEVAADDLATLELTPPPGRVRRAFMVRVILPGVTTA